MSEECNSIHFERLAREARKLAERQSDPVMARTLREKAIQHDRLARKLKRKETSTERSVNKAHSVLNRLFRR